MKTLFKRSQLINWFLAKPKTTGYLVFSLLFLTLIFIVLQHYKIIKDNKRREMSSVLSMVEQNIDQSLKNCHTTALTLALTVNDNGIPENFEAVSQKLLDSNPMIETVEIVPHGVIKYIYPVSGNEAAYNLDLFHSKYLQQEAYKSIQQRKMYFAGPLKLRQGRVAIVGRLPIYKKNEFWGFSAVIVNLESMLKGLKSIENSKYYLQFSKIDPNTKKEIFYLPKKENFRNKLFQTSTITDGNWNIYIISKSDSELIYELLPILILGILLSIILGILAATILKKPSEMQRQLQFQARKILNNEIKFKTIFDQAAVGIAHIDSINGNYIEVNSQYCKMLGYSFDEIKSIHFKELTHPEDLEENILKVNELKSGRVSEFTMEKRYFHKNGNIIWVNLTASAITNQEKSLSIIAIIEDITSKKEAEELIKKSEIRFKSLFEDSPIALWEEDFSKVKILLNELNLIGKPREEITTYFQENPEIIWKCISLVKIIDVNNECLTLHYPKTKKDLMGKLEKVVNNDAMDSFSAQLIAITQGETQLMIDSKVKKNDGEYRDICLRWSVMRDYEDTLERVIISTEDITSRKETEEVIIQSQKKIESLINTIDGIVWECNYDDYKFTFINNKAEEITGYSKEEWLGDADFWENTIHPEDKDETLNYCSIQSKINNQYDFEYRMVTKDGAIIWIRDIVNVIYEDQKPVSLKGIMIDITKRKQGEHDLKKSFDLVNEQNKRLLNFSYIVSHNLRSHTSNIQSISSLIETSETEEERLELIKMMQVVSNTLNETMLNLNDVVNIQTNLNLVLVSLNLKENIDKTIRILSEQITFKNAIICNKVDASVVINYNPAYLESILLNFISNSIRYSHLDRKPVVTLESFEEKGKTVLKISDNGIGIDLKKNGEKLFGMYKTFHDNPDSKGIGLFITKNQIDAMEGSIVVESELNSGTTFKIYFK